MERRDFVKSTAIAAAGTIVTPAMALNGTRKPFVIIIGAGISGLAAAYTLKKKDIPYIILEARNRVGGRIFTHTMDVAEGLTCELGAEWIGASHEKIIGLCKEFNLEMLNHQYDTRLIYDNRFFDTNDWSYSEAAKKFELAKQKYHTMSESEKKAMDKMDWWRYLDRLGLTEKDIELRELLDSTDFGETIRNVSAFAAMSEYAESSEKNEMDFWVKGGNSRLIDALHNFVGTEQVKTGHAVEKVVQSGGKITVLCKNGFVVQGHQMICTIPTYAINNIVWEPGFSVEKKEALNELQYCRIMKASILFSERFWKDESFDMITDTPGQYYFHSTKLQDGKKGVLTSYTIGDKSYLISKMNREQKIAALTEGLKAGFGDVKKYVNDIVTYYWGNDTYTQGAYAIYDTRQWFNLRPALLEPHKNIHFAGEYLADWQGFMEGSIVTGMDAAEKVTR